MSFAILLFVWILFTVCLCLGPPGTVHLISCHKRWEHHWKLTTNPRHRFSLIEGVFFLLPRPRLLFPSISFYFSLSFPFPFPPFSVFSFSLVLSLPFFFTSLSLILLSTSLYLYPLHLIDFLTSFLYLPDLTLSPLYIPTFAPSFLLYPSLFLSATTSEPFIAVHFTLL